MVARPARGHAAAGPGAGCRCGMCARTRGATGARLAAHLNLQWVSTQTSPPSIAIAPPVLGGPESVRVVLNSTSSTACVIAGCVGHTSVHSLRLCHSDRGPRAWGSGGCALCVSQQQQHPNLHGPRDLLVLPDVCPVCVSAPPGVFLPDVAVETEVKHRNFLVKRVTPSVRSFVIATRHFPAAGTWHRRAVEGAGAKVARRSSSAEYRG